MKNNSTKKSEPPTEAQLQEKTLAVFKSLPLKFQEKMLKRLDEHIESESEASIKTFLTLLKKEFVRCAE